MGYVGLPLANEFSKKFKVYGYDINIKRINDLKKKIDETNEVYLRRSKNLLFTYNLQDLKTCNVFIITVPTPVYKNNLPDLRNLEQACLMVSKIMKKGSIIIFESTVYPGCTEEFCNKIIEKYSNLKLNKDFYIGYIPKE